MRNICKVILFFICGIIFPLHSYGQLSNFTLQVTPVNESCSGNGSLNFTVSGTTPGASVLCNLYKFPNVTTPIATLAANDLGGLTAGVYLIVATQSLGTQSNSQQQEVTIENTYVPLIYQGIGSSCGGNGEITIEASQGFSVLYEIFAGPVTMPPQASNVFTNMPLGAYSIRVFDACGEGVTKPFIFTAVPGGMDIGLGATSDSELPSCDEIAVSNSITAPAGYAIIYPLSIELTVFPPFGVPVTISQTIAEGSAQSTSTTSIIPFFHDQPYTYNLQVTDGCGNVFTLNNNTVDEQLEVFLSAAPIVCSKGLNVIPIHHSTPFYVTFTASPPGFDPVLFNANHPGPFSDNPTYFNASTPLPAGVYTVTITDACGRTSSNSTVFDPEIPLFELSYSQSPGCETNMGSIALSSPNGALVSVIITSAPIGYPQTLPYNVSFNLNDGVLFMNSFPAGNYIFQTVDECGNSLTTPVLIGGYQYESHVAITEGCGSFDLMLDFTSTLSQPQFWLQKLDPISGIWVHPETGVGNGDFPEAETAFALSNGMNSYLMFSGTFRVVLAFTINGNGSPQPVGCVNELYTFEFNSTPQIINVSSFACDPTTYDILVEAIGVGPLLYRITQKDGLPFLLENGTSSLFIGVEPAIYNFQVEDACGNIMNRLYDTTEPFIYVVTASVLCDGQQATLSVPEFTFLNYQWWKDGAPSTILSTSATLTFPSFNTATDTGLYHVRIYAPDTTPSCIDFVVDYEIFPVSDIPEAGIDNAMSICGNPGTIDLSTLLSGTFDVGGIWSETSTSGGILTDASFDASMIPAGVYEFKYTVAGWCDSEDEATFTITINDIPDSPEVSPNQQVCVGADLQLTAIGNVSYSYQWLGPNGFTSNEQNPLIENISLSQNGIYTVSASDNGCGSASVSTELIIDSIPNFTVDAECVNNAYTLSVIPNNGDLPADATYTWSGPENFTASGNPIVITHLPSGIYSVIVSSSGCEATAPITVGGTFCTFPLGISPNDDGDNDTFDLSGFDIEYIKIFNRYGMVVYDKLNYLKEWDGKDYNGNNLPSATYYYYARFRSGEEKTGWVYLIRR